MQPIVRVLALAALAAAFLALPLTASAVPPSAAEATATFDYTPNMHPLGFSPNPVPLDNTVPGAGVFNSDLGFWGKTAVQGTYSGFRLVNGKPEADRRLDGVRQPDEHRRQSGRHHHLGRPRYPLLELADSRTHGGRSADSRHRPRPVHDAGRFLR